MLSVFRKIIECSLLSFNYENSLKKSCDCVQEEQMKSDEKLLQSK